MEATSSLAWCTRPAVVFMAVFYCFVVLIQASLWVAHDGFQ
jgi:hypothetical protein